MTKIYNVSGQLIRQSRNLRGLLDHARREIPVTIECGLRDVDSNYPIRVTFDNGDYAWTRFADWRVAADWFAARRRWGRLEIGMANAHCEFSARFLRARLRRDRRYSIQPEFCGFGDRRFVVRFCREYIGVGDTESEALSFAVWHDSERMKESAT